MSFNGSISDAVFLFTSFSIYDHSVWLILSLCCAHFQSFFSSTGVVVVALANLRWSVLPQKSCHKLVVSTSFWSWLLNVSSVLTSLKYTVTTFSGC